MLGFLSQILPRAITITAIGLAVALQGPAVLLAAETSEESRPNVLFLICDDLNCDIGCYGHPQVKTPNIDRLAARGVRFENAYCQFPLCGPSRASFMTGLYPDQTLVRRNAIYIREHVPNVKTMSQMFRDAGYFATRIGKIYHYNVPLHIGTSGHDDPYSWDYTINPRGRDRDDEPLIFSLVPGSFGGTLSWLAADGTDREQTDGIAADEASQMLKQFAEEDTPFFLAVGLYRPHTPYVAPKRYFDMYPLDQINVPSVPNGYLETIPAPARRTITRKKDQLDLDPALARQAIQAYYASITFRRCPARPDPRCARFASTHRQHCHRFYFRSWLSHGRTWPLAKDHAVRERGSRAAGHGRTNDRPRRQLQVIG